MPSLAIRSGLPRSGADGASRFAILQRLGWSYRDSGAVVFLIAASGAILVNAVFMQSGPHPAPIFTGVLAPIVTAATNDTSVGSARVRDSALPKADSAKKSEPAKVEAPVLSKTPVETISEIQRELARRGFYDGTIDGLYGSRTDAAIRDFEHTAGLKPSTEPNGALLRTIKTSNAKAAKPATTGAGSAHPTPPAPIPPARSESAARDPINEALASSKRVVAVQRALADYGYGQIRPSGVLDRETKTAIERFERERKLPVTGAVSDRLARELAAVTGRPLE